MQDPNIAQEQIDMKRARLDLYYRRESEMLSGGVQSYGIGTRNLTRYNTELSVIRAAIRSLEEEIAGLESASVGNSARRAVSVVIRDW